MTLKKEHKQATHSQYRTLDAWTLGENLVDTMTKVLLGVGIVESRKGKEMTMGIGKM